MKHTQLDATSMGGVWTGGRGTSLKLACPKCGRPAHYHPRGKKGGSDYCDAEAADEGHLSKWTDRGGAQVRKGRAHLKSLLVSVWNHHRPPASGWQVWLHGTIIKTGDGVGEDGRAQADAWLKGGTA